MSPKDGTAQIDREIHRVFGTVRPFRYNEGGVSATPKSKYDIPQQVSLSSRAVVAMATLALGCGRVGYAEVDPPVPGDTWVDSGSLTDSNVTRRQNDAPAFADASNDASDGAAEASCAQDTCAPCTGSAECTCTSYAGQPYRFCAAVRSWMDAEGQCTMVGMHLARIDEALENAWIRSMADANGLGQLWIGAVDATRTSSWQWPDGTQFWNGTTSGSPVGGLYNNWYVTSPSGSPTRTCAAMMNTEVPGQWQDRSCTSLLPYVCELY